MPGFRRAQLRGSPSSEELFRPTQVETDESGGQAAAVAELDEDVSPVPRAPNHDVRSVRLNGEEIILLADAIQRLKFPHKVTNRPSIDDFERLEHLRKKLISGL